MPLPALVRKKLIVGSAGPHEPRTIAIANTEKALIFVMIFLSVSSDQ
jgi:hypothetical protein